MDMVIKLQVFERLRIYHGSIMSCHLQNSDQVNACLKVIEKDA